MKFSSFCLGILGVWIVTVCTVVVSGDEVVVVNGETEKTLIGKILVEAQNENGILFQTDDGKLLSLQPDVIKSKKVDTESGKPLTRKALGRKLRDELGDQFRIHEAGNFVILYNTEQTYARWVAGLYRRFEKSFKSTWNRNKFNLTAKPEFPLPIIIFKSKQEYDRYMEQDIGAVNSAMRAYYNLETNRVAMFDLTADEIRPGERINERRINEVLGNPRAVQMVATIIHEGTHQLMFNYGMQTRFSDTPLWLNEGMAMYFETPDLKSTNGWRSIGQINFFRLSPFLNYLPNRPSNSLEKMIGSDDGFRDAHAADNYAQAWAFNYFLLNNHKKAYVEYLKHISSKPRLIYGSAEQRVQEFQQFFDIDLLELDRQFINYVQGLNR